MALRGRAGIVLGRGGDVAQQRPEAILELDHELALGVRLQHEDRRPAHRVSKHGRRDDLRLRLELLVTGVLDVGTPRLKEVAELPVRLDALLALGLAHRVPRMLIHLGERHLAATLAAAAVRLRGHPVAPVHLRVQRRVALLQIVTQAVVLERALLVRHPGCG